jgi:rod shape-determining protein MreD
VSRSASLALRVALLAVLAVLIQATALSQLSILGVSIDLSPLLVASIGLLAGSMAGALAGFGVGLLADLVLVQTLGISSLLLVGLGYAAGRLHELRDPAHALVPLVVGALATFLFEAGGSIIHVMLGVDAPMSPLLIRDVFAITLVNGIIAVPVHAIVRRAVQGALPEEKRRRRRRAYTTGGLSPLTTSGSK